MRREGKMLAIAFYLALAGAVAAANTGKAQDAREPSERSFSTRDVACDVSHQEYNASAALESRYRWRCSDQARILTGNGVPDHAVGQFPNRSNPTAISEQNVSASMPLSPILGESRTGVGPRWGAYVYAMNSVKFDPATAGACPSGASRRSHCSLAHGQGPWRIEALGQDVFDFGEDMNNAHVQPTGEYHYHGIPEGILENAGVSDANRKMLLVGWAADGFPVYARYCYADAMDPESDIKICEGSYRLDNAADRGRPSTEWFPLGVFTSDWNYANGSGDLDECNGRVGVTPEFPSGVYYYMATDSYPYFSRCIKGEFEPAQSPMRRRRPPGRRPH